MDVAEASDALSHSKLLLFDGHCLFVRAISQLDLVDYEVACNGTAAEFGFNFLFGEIGGAGLV